MDQIHEIQNRRTSTVPIKAPRTVRAMEVKALTSLPAGRCVPIHYSGLLREDSVRSSTLRLSFEMHETAEVLMNGVAVRVMAYVVPMSALPRFDSIEDVNKSYMGKPPIPGAGVVPYFYALPAPGEGTHQIHNFLGESHPAGKIINYTPVEAYNEIFNHRAKNRSPHIPLRGIHDSLLAPAFWYHSGFQHIVPDFDNDLIDGEVPLNLASGRIPVSGIGTGSGTVFDNGSPLIESDGTSTPAAQVRTSQGVYIRESAIAGVPDVFAELADRGITVSLANIQVAKETAAFAQLRTKYNQHDDYIIDLLMQAVEVPEQAHRQPMLVGQASTVFGMSKRYSTTSGSLDESAVNGLTSVDLNINVPRINTGGVLMVVAEILPEQLFERQEDPYTNALSPDDLPNYLQDRLDPEKVELVKNRYVDTKHQQPDEPFGYAPLNHAWAKQPVRIGGRFRRGSPTEPFTEDRQRIWAVEQPNPVLGTDFYLSTNIHTQVFADTVQDPFEVVTRGTLAIEGNTVFGPALLEATDDYEQVLAEVDFDRLEEAE